MNQLDISVIIPFKDKAKMTLDSVHTLIKYNPVIKEILLVSNNSSDDQLEHVKTGVAGYSNARVVTYNQPFNYQKMNNWAAQQTQAKFILFLNNDTECTEDSRGLLEEMYKKAQAKDVGMVGCLLLYGDQKTIQHAGVFLRPGLQGDHLYVGQSLKNVLQNTGSQKYPYDIREPRALTAVTGAAQLIERKKFDAVNGFDERFIICGGDVDLCIRLNQAGYQTWYIGSTRYIIHKESQSRSYKPVPYIDFYYSYKSYISAYDTERGDPFVPKITQGMQ